MPATAADIKYYPGADGAAATDPDPYGGAITTGGGELDEDTPEIVITAVPAPSGADESYYGAFYRKNTHASSDWTEAFVTNRAGMIDNAGSGLASVVSTSASDTGVLRVTGTIASVWTQDDLTVDGTDTVFGVETYDAGGVWRAEYLVAGVAAQPVGNLTIAVDGEVVAVLYGSASSPGRTLPIGSAVSREWQVAVASNLDDTIGESSRLTIPTVGSGSGEVSAFSQAVKWNGSGAVDQSIAVPGGDLDFGHYIGIAVQFEAKDGIPAPVSGYVFYDIDVLGVPT